MLFFNVFFKTLGFLTALVIFILILNIIFFILPKNIEADFKFTEGDRNSSNVIAKLNLSGPIIDNTNLLLEGYIYGVIDPIDVKKYINSIIKLKPKILIIKINSPGGTVSASAEIEKLILDFKKNSQIKVYFITNQILTSGAYWVATTGDKIFATYGSIIGSIGVSGPSWYYYNKPISISSGLFGNTINTENGIQVFNQNSGESKDLFNPFRKPTSKELNHLQKMIDEIYDDFLNTISKSRKIEKDNLKNKIGALIYTGYQAKDNYLIDDIISYDILIKKIIKEENYSNYKVVENVQNNNIFERYFLNLLKFNSNLICNKLNSNFVTILPGYFKNC